jgi:hypothetical protein
MGMGLQDRWRAPNIHALCTRFLHHDDRTERLRDLLARSRRAAPRGGSDIRSPLCSATAQPWSWSLEGVAGELMTVRTRS